MFKNDSNTLISTNKNKSTSYFKHYHFLSMVYCTLLIVSVLFPYKIINFFGFSEPGGIFIFPLTYLLGGVIAEGYGRKLAIKMVLNSLFCLMLFNIIVAIIVRIPSVPNAPNQDVFLKAFGHSIRLSTGCLVGLICSDLTNVYRITKLKLIFGGKYFAQRCLWATALSEAIFNITTYSITYAGILTNHSIVNLIFYSWGLKMIYSVILVIPLLYLMKFIKESEGVDIYDTNDNNIHAYNPEAIIVNLINAKKVSGYSN